MIDINNLEENKNSKITESTMETKLNKSIQNICTELRLGDIVKPPTQVLGGLLHKMYKV